MSQQHESGGHVQPNVNPFLQPNHDREGVQPNVNPVLQPNHENEDVQPNVNSSLQPNNDSVPRAGSSEEQQLSQPKNAVSGGVQPNVNPGGSAHQQQLTEAQIAANYEIGSAEHLNYYRPLYLAAQRGDWETARCFIEHDPNALTAVITVHSQRILHVAALCCQWGFILKLLELLTPESIAVQDSIGFTVLHRVAQGGSLKTAKALIKKNDFLPQIRDGDGNPPLAFSIFSGNKELVWYLSLITRVESTTILRLLIKSGYHAIALYFVRRYPNLALATDKDGESLLYWLTINPSCFFSGSNLGLFERWIYKYVHVEINNSPTHSVIVNMEETTEVLQWYKRILWKAIAQLAPSVNMVRDEKLKHECAVELINHVCKKLSSMSIEQIEHFLRNPEPILGSAVTCGIEEIVRALLQHFPDVIFSKIKPNRNILQTAIEYRNEKIVNTIREISPTITMALCGKIMESGNTTLHLAGKLAPTFKLFSVSGGALQMQRELQWFKEVENITFPFRRKEKNRNNETAKDVFRKKHKELAKQGEKWMKDTANSCMLVSTLIATILFAAAFTVPGGNINDSGIPIFLRTNAFTVFAVSDALGLFSSLTSLLMFLAILTARYEQEDFLESLPKKLIIGLGSLFFSIAAMIIAFGAAQTIVLSKRWNWVSLPIALVASFPVAIFVMLQLPLFVQMVQSTYGVTIFRPWPSRV